VTLAARDLESLDLVETLRERKRRPGTKWCDLAVLYRSHLHCEQVAAELIEQEIPFFIENMNVLDTTEARDLFACAGAVVSSADAASLFRVSALPQWEYRSGESFVGWFVRSRVKARSIECSRFWKKPRVGRQPPR
jgi:ATP-dependent exoDNAse (exonuclease V) beta subunit